MEAKYLNAYKIHKKRQKSLIIALAVGILCLILIFAKQNNETIHILGKIALFSDLVYLFLVDASLNIKSVKMSEGERRKLNNQIILKAKKKYRLNRRGQIIFKRIVPMLVVIALIIVFAISHSIVNVFISLLVLIMLFLIFEYLNS